MSAPCTNTQSSMRCVNSTSACIEQAEQTTMASISVDNGSSLPTPSTQTASPSWSNVKLSDGQRDRNTCANWKVQHRRRNMGHWYCWRHCHGSQRERDGLSWGATVRWVWFKLMDMWTVDRLDSSFGMALRGD